jgi:hypothetical protein
LLTEQHAPLIIGAEAVLLSVQHTHACEHCQHSMLCTQKMSLMADSHCTQLVASTVLRQCCFPRKTSPAVGGSGASSTGMSQAEQSGHSKGLCFVEDAAVVIPRAMTGPYMMQLLQAQQGQQPRYVPGQLACTAAKLKPPQMAWCIRPDLTLLCNNHMLWRQGGWSTADLHQICPTEDRSCNKQIGQLLVRLGDGYCDNTAA